MENPTDRPFRWRAAAVGLALGAMAGVAGCAGLRTDYQIARERAQAYVASHPELDPETARAISENKLRKGMTKEQAVAAWGRPAVVRRFGSQEQWFFGCHWPHHCEPPERRSVTWPLIPPERIYLSDAIFENGRVVDFERH